MCVFLADGERVKSARVLPPHLFPGHMYTHQETVRERRCVFDSRCTLELAPRVNVNAMHEWKTASKSVCSCLCANGACCFSVRNVRAF